MPTNAAGRITDPVEPGIWEGIVDPVRAAIVGLGFDVACVRAKPMGLVVPGTAADALIDQAADYLLDDALGLSLARRIPIGSLGVLDYGFCTSATLRQGLTRLVRYYGAATQRARLELVEAPPFARLIHHRLPGMRPSRHWVEFAIATIANRIRQTVEPRVTVAFHETAFKHGPPARRAVHDEFFATRVEFSAKEDSISVEASLLDCPLWTASPDLTDLLDRRLSELAAAMRPRDPLLDRILHLMAEMLDQGLTDLATLADRLGERRRTLQRLLGERSTSHTALLDELRCQRAAKLLDEGLRVVDVAKQVGFSNPSAFFRAHRRWTGTSPKQRSRRG
jgi:AraC-like DNA-binding protein